MKVYTQGSRLLVSEIEQLGANSTAVLQSELVKALNSAIGDVELDLSSTRFADCCGIGALISMRALAENRSPGIAFHISNAPPKVERLLRLTKTDAVFGCRRGAGSGLSVTTQTVHQPMLTKEENPDPSGACTMVSVQVKPTVAGLNPPAKFAAAGGGDR